MELSVKPTEGLGGWMLRIRIRPGKMGNCLLPNPPFPPLHKGGLELRRRNMVPFNGTLGNHYFAGESRLAPTVKRAVRRRASRS